MTATNQAEIASYEAVFEPLQGFFQSAYEGLARISQGLDQALGADMTTALITMLGVFSLVLAVFPFWSAWRKFFRRSELAPAQDPVQRDATGEEIVQMHPECLQTLYGVAAVSPTADVIPVQPQPEPEMVRPAPERGQDLPLGLIADLSEELTQQHKTVLALQRLSEQQQLQIQSLMAQMKAQSSAFLLQGERLLRLESISEAMPEVSPEEADAEDLQRLSTFDQAIELARQGASAEELMSRCRLSVSEARLVVLVHGKQAG